MKDLNFLKLEYRRNEEIKKILDSEDYVDLNRLSEKYNLSMNSLNYIIKNINSIQIKLLERINLIEEVCLKYQNGSTLQSISEEYNTTRQNINRIISLGNLNRYNGGISKKKSNRIEKIKSFVSEGKSLEFLIEYLNLSEYTIRNYCNDNGIEVFTENQIKFNKIKSEILNLRKNGKSQLEIGKALDISQSYVSKVLLAENQRTYLSSEEFLNRDKQIFSEFSNGNDLSSLSEKYNMSISNIRRILKKIS